MNVTQGLASLCKLYAVKWWHHPRCISLIIAVQLRFHVLFTHTYGFMVVGVLAHSGSNPTSEYYS